MDKLKYKLDRGIHGYSQEDTLNFDEYIARLIKENCYIIASEFNSHPDSLTDKEWKQILLDISFGFGSYLEMRSGVYLTNESEFKRLKQEYQNGMKLFSLYHEYLWN